MNLSNNMVNNYRNSDNESETPKIQIFKLLLLNKKKKNEF